MVVENLPLEYTCFFNFWSVILWRYYLEDIHTSTRHILVDIIHKFPVIVGFPNMVDAIDGTHIFLSSRPQRHLTPIPCVFPQKIP